MGEKKGRKEGKEEGRNEEKNEMAKEMKKDGESIEKMNTDKKTSKMGILFPANYLIGGI